MMCAAQAGQRGRRVLLIEHANKLGERIRISGGGRCNFTNREVSAANYLSQNPHFCAAQRWRNIPSTILSPWSNAIASPLKSVSMANCSASKVLRASSICSNANAIRAGCNGQCRARLRACSHRRGMMVRVLASTPHRVIFTANRW